MTPATKPRVSDERINRILNGKHWPRMYDEDIRLFVENLRDARATIAQQAEEIEQLKAELGKDISHDKLEAQLTAKDQEIERLKGKSLEYEIDMKIFRRERDAACAQLATTRKRALEEAAEEAENTADALAAGACDTPIEAELVFAATKLREHASIVRALINGDDK